MTTGVFTNSPSASNSANYPAIYPGTIQQVAYTGTAGTSSAFGATTTMVRLIATTACYIAFGASPTATTGGQYLAANVPEYFGVIPGQKVSAVQVAAGGTLHVCEAA